MDLSWTRELTNERRERPEAREEERMILFGIWAPATDDFGTRSI